MAELKPRQDNEMAGEKLKAGAPGKPIPSTETKPHGDKLRDIFEDDNKKPAGKPH
jgi:hypothetical protein